MAAERARSPWFWKLAGALLAATGVFLALLPAALPGFTAVLSVVFYASAAAFAAIGAAFFLTAPAPNVFLCPSCRRETRKGKHIYFCPGCGRAMDEGDDELKPSEILCPHCDEVIAKKPGACAACGKALPGFGVETRKGQALCRWCKYEVAAGEKFCKFCSAPLAATRLS